LSDLQKDLVLSSNEYSYVLDQTKGFISCLVGPTKMSLSQSDSLVTFNTHTKKFESCSYGEAIKLLTICPENWYCILKNPTKDNKHPAPGASNVLPDTMEIGKKINIMGPVAFALYPGQMAKVVRGHALRSNQYLLARVYEANAANNSQGEIRNADGELVETTKTNYVNGQILVIKGTEVSFYIPPTGIEVIPVDNNDKNGYIREAVTLERLEYCILKDEDGNKRYVHGPQVVFPKPTETFVTSPKGGFIFRAVELSKISGIYVKVIAEYKDVDSAGKEIVHPVGEELFITGNDQMIYYPRPEHAIITYDGKMMHHAIAIPEGEGRYIMNRLTGEIKTVKGPQMYLPDPRLEVVVKRKLSRRQCELMYPGNKEALAYNEQLSERAVEKAAKNSMSFMDELTAFSINSSINDTLANLEAKANISRGTSYTKPRTITLDNKFDGVVTTDVWTGYAVNVISKDGTRKVVCGPQTVMLDYDQTLEELQLSTGRPKTTDNMIHTCFLRHENNKVSDLIHVETKDFVRCSIKVSYCVDFDKKYQDKWFNVDNYIKFMCDRERSLMKKAVKNYTIEELNQNYVDIIRNVAINKKDYSKESNADKNEHKGRFFAENGMYVNDCEVLSLHIEDEDIAEMLVDHQREIVKKSLQLSAADKRVQVAEKLTVAEKKENKLKSDKLINKMNLQREEAIRTLEIQTEVNRKKEAEEEAAAKAKKELQTVLDLIGDAERARKDKDMKQEIAFKQELANIEQAKQKAYADTVSAIMGAVSPDLVAALTANANSDMVSALEHAVAPYAIAQGEESVADVVARLTKGLPIEEAIEKLSKTKKV
jgi:major vault protein